MWQIAQVALMGPHSEFVLSGSDDGHIFAWDRASGRLLNILRGGGDATDAGVLCVAPHPSDPILASCGQQPIVRLWAPQARQPPPGSAQCPGAYCHHDESGLLESECQLWQAAACAGCLQVLERCLSGVLLPARMACA